MIEKDTVLKGRYKIVERLGGNAVGDTYLAEDPSSAQKFAIKEISQERMAAVYTALRDSGPMDGIVQVTDVFDENQNTYAVMEYVQGLTIESYLSRNNTKFKIGRIKNLLSPVLGSMIQLAEKGIHHGNISADNFVFTNDGLLKLIGFGTASNGNISDKARAYAPVEFYESAYAGTELGDIYSVSAFIYRCITGVIPQEALSRRVNDTCMKPSSMGIEISENEEAALLMGMEVDSSRRIMRLAAFYRAFYNMQAPVISPQPVAAAEDDRTEVIDTGDRGSVPPVRMPNALVMSPPPKRRSKNTLLVMLLVICVTAALVLGVFLFLLMKGDTGKIGLFGNKTVKQQEEYDYSEDAGAKDASAADDTAMQDKIVGIDDNTNIDIKDKISEIDNAISDYGSLDELDGALGSYLELAQQYGNADGLGEAVYQLFGAYQALVIERVKNCDGQDESAALYKQMSLDLETALEYADAFSTCGIGVFSDDLAKKESEIKGNYKFRIISKYDECAGREIRENGVVSRSELWKRLDGIRDTNLYNDADPEDALSLRYASALALHTDNELEGLDTGSANTLIYQMLADTNYNPVLVYYLYKNGDVSASQWYQYYQQLDRDLERMSEADRKNMMYYYYTDLSYQQIRQDFSQYMKQQSS